MSKIKYDGIVSKESKALWIGFVVQFTQRSSLREWQKIIFNGTANLAIALMVAGIISLVLEHKAVMKSVGLIVGGVYIFAYSALHAKHIEEQTWKSS